MTSSYETVLNGTVYRVEMECEDRPAQNGLWLNAEPMSGIIGGCVQAPWVTAPRVSHLPSR